MDYLSALNEKQLEAVTETEGYLRVIAGAGSGKTKLLVSRYAYLVKEYGINSANILCVTFTNKAAGEMKRRIRSLIGKEYDTSLICTYHGFCVRVLREDIEKIFYPKEFQIIDNDTDARPWRYLTPDSKPINLRNPLDSQNPIDVFDPNSGKINLSDYLEEA